MTNETINKSKEELILEIKKRVEDKIIENSNADLIIKLINNSDSLSEAIAIAQLGTTYKRTGFHFDKRLEKMDNTIKYFKKNKKLSFVNDEVKLTHKLIIGDNYDALLNLLIEYRNKIDVIYIDPPYGKDSMGEFADVNYNNSITRDNLLSMMYPRLFLAKSLLSDCGVIFCSIDDRNQAYVKCQFDEIFGESNFIGSFIWQKKTGGGQADDYFVTEHEYILAYRKSKEFEWLDFYEDLTETDFKYYDKEKNEKFAITKLEKWGNSAHKEDRPTMYFSIKAPDGSDFFPMSPDGLDGRWRVGKTKMTTFIEENRIYWDKDHKTGRWIPYEKKYFSETKGKLNKSRSILYKIAETGTATNELTSIFGQKDVFVNAKPTELIKHLIQHVNCDIILDFFAGSGTTGQAVMQLNKEDGCNRQFILCTNNEINNKNPNGIAYDVTSKRLKRIMSGECYDGTKDFDWIRNNEPYGDNLDVYEINKVANFESSENKTPFDVIDETLYGLNKFTSIKDKIEWVCNNFEHTQKNVESDDKWRERLEIK